MPARRVAGLRVVVTGGSSGIGRQLAMQLASSGARVLATARRANRLAELTDEIPATASGSIDTLAGDLTDPEHRAAIAAWTAGHWGAIDVLINNAGGGAIGPFASADPERLRRIMEINFFAPVELTRQLMPLLRGGTRPAILIVGSVLALRGVPRKSEYCAAKFALRGWAESIRVELVHEGIEVLQIHPSTTRSEFFDSLTDTPAGESSKNVGSMEPAAVASAAIRGLVRSRRELILSPGGRALVWASKRFPATVDRLLARFG